MSAYLDIIILLFVVIMIFAKLKSLLGTRPNNETELSRENAAKIFEIIMKEKNQKGHTPEGGVLKAVNLSELSETDRQLLKIPGFDKEHFLDSACKAFEIIVVAFANADTAKLKPLLDSKLFTKFQTVIKQRQKDGITAETDFVGFKSTEITDVKISKSGLAKISVKFVSEQANLLRDSQGNIIEGDENFIQSITDIWTFERDLNSSSPVWLLASTKK